MEKKLEYLRDLLSVNITDTFEKSSKEYLAIEVIASQMANEISACSRKDSRGQSYAPDQYTLSLNPLDFEELQEHDPAAQGNFSNAISKVLDATGYLYIRNPNVTLSTDPTLSRKDVRVIAWHSRDPLQFSKEMNDEDVSILTNPPKGAFFIIEGKQYFSLNQKTVKIGRRLDNDLILEDRHVSRSHARLDVVEGRYVIIDLDSTAGTRVNGRLITRHTLRPGDIVSIAAVQLIYGEDPGGPPGDASRYKPTPGAGDERDQVTPLNLFLFNKTTTPYEEG
jgi:hypothetical protein